MKLYSKRFLMIQSTFQKITRSHQMLLTLLDACLIAMSIIVLVLELMALID